MTETCFDTGRKMDTVDTLSEFFDIPMAERQEMLLDAIFEVHQWHYARNRSYRQAVESKGIGERISESNLVRLLRPTAHVFKSYLDHLETPFPENHPQDFLKWLAGILSIEIPEERFQEFKMRYANLESFLQAIEENFANRGFVIGTSSGTSGKSTIMVMKSSSLCLSKLGS
jgi:hypothetical protein